MKVPFDFFFVSEQYLEIDHIESSVQHFFDKIASEEFYKAVATIADKYSVDYLIARGHAIEIQRSQSTFSLYGICNHIFEGKNWIARQFTFLIVQNTNLEKPSIIITERAVSDDEPLDRDEDMRYRDDYSGYNEVEEE